MEFEVSYSLDNEQQFWDELEEIVSAPYRDHEQVDNELIDNALRTYLQFTSKFKGSLRSTCKAQWVDDLEQADEYLGTEYQISQCSYSLLQSALFSEQKDYCRRQIIYGLLQEDAKDTLHLITSFLLCDGRQNEATFEMMNEEGAFPRLVELTKTSQGDGDGELHRRLLELVYEMSRIQRIRCEELGLIDDGFVTSLFDIIEQLSDDVNDPYHYPVIRVLLVFNEQYMVSAHGPDPDQTPMEPLTNRVIKLLSLHGSSYMTFGENLILLLNREDETSLQLLILKLLYLMFTTKPTNEYFYTNDLHVLLDVILRNLLDLPDDATTLRHTYLRVLSPFLTHTQLRHPPHYKRAEIQFLLEVLAGGRRSAHFAPVDDTTIRLVERCRRVPWLMDANDNTSPTSPTTNTSTLQHETDPPGLPASEPAKHTLGISLPSAAAASSISVLEVAGSTERPGVLTKSRTNGVHGTHTGGGKGPGPPVAPRRKGGGGRAAAAANKAAAASAMVSSLGKAVATDGGDDSTGGTGNGVTLNTGPGGTTSNGHASTIVPTITHTNNDT
ncbi:MAG: hypothetical protein M1833_005038 [Piccolia ochrophora]|nr:MAG: hypothetical protein M1833_005038 [Piccolia ochrophora]